MNRKILPLVLAAALALPAAAQEEQPTTTAAANPAATAPEAGNPESAETEATGTAETGESTATSARQTRELLYGILQRLPPHVGKAIKLDPSLWSNQAYLATYPELAAFANAHPEVAFHAGYFLDTVYVPGDPSPEPPGMRMWNQLIEMIGIFFMVLVFLGAFLWLIRTILNQRRWNRLSRVHTEVHTKLLDRFGTNEELMAYLNTEPGRRFLAAAPIIVEEQPSPGPRPVPSPLGRVLWPVQAGVVLAAAGLGLLFVSWTVTQKEVSEPFAALGTLGVAIGLGFVGAAAVSWVLSRKLGLLQVPANIGDTNVEATSE